MGLVGFSPGGEEGYTAGIEWILQQLQMYNKDFDYPVYALSLFFYFPLVHAYSATVPTNQLQQPPPSKFLPTQHSESYLTQHCNLCILTDAWSNTTVVSFLLHDVWCQDIWFICWRMIIVQEKAVCATLLWTDTSSLHGNEICYWKLLNNRGCTDSNLPYLAEYFKCLYFPKNYDLYDHTLLSM